MLSFSFVITFMLAESERLALCRQKRTVKFFSSKIHSFTPLMNSPILLFQFLIFVLYRFSHKGSFVFQAFFVFFKINNVYSDIYLWKSLLFSRGIFSHKIVQNYDSEIILQQFKAYISFLSEIEQNGIIIQLLKNIPISLNYF